MPKLMLTMATSVSYTHLDVYKRQVYVDDLLITSTNWEEHCQRVEHVLNKLSENNITLKLEKSQFIAREVQFLGFQPTELGITPSTEQIEAIQKFPTPKNKKQLPSFLGLCNYYRKFQSNYSELTTRLSPQLSSKDRLSLIHI